MDRRSTGLMDDGAVTGPIAAAPARDFGHLVAESTAPLFDGALPDPRPIDARPPDGWFELVDGRGVYLRRTDPGGGGSVPGPSVTVGAPPAVLPQVWYIHGLAGAASNWTSLAGLLADRAVGYIVDLPGHGRSDPPPRDRYSLTDNADLVAALIRRRADEPVHLVGNSLGGMVAVALAGRYPELVRTLTLISPAVPDVRMTADRGADPRLAVLLLPGTTSMATRRISAYSPVDRAHGMAQACFGDPSSISADQYAAAAAELAWRAGLGWVHTSLLGSLRALMSSYLVRGAGSFRSLTSRIAVPTLVIWGTRDRLVDPRLAGRTAASFPDATLLMIPGVGHTAMMEDPLLTARAIIARWDTAAAGRAAEA